MEKILILLLETAASILDQWEKEIKEFDVSVKHGEGFDGKNYIQLAQKGDEYTLNKMKMYLKLVRACVKQPYYTPELNRDAAAATDMLRFHLNDERIVNLLMVKSEPRKEYFGMQKVALDALANLKKYVTAYKDEVDMLDIDEDLYKDEEIRQDDVKYLEDTLERLELAEYTLREVENACCYQEEDHSNFKCSFD